MKVNKKAMGLNDLSGIAITFVVVAIVLGIGATILTSVQTGQTANGFAWNATAGGLAGLQQISSWQVTLAIITVAAVVIGVISLFGRS
jgi:hypothetical protein